VEDARLPNTDSPEVVQHAIALHLVTVIWDQAYRTVDPDEMENTLLDLYRRIFKAIHTAGDDD
jgi:hypothetical protein